MSNKYFKRRYNPGTPKVCRKKPVPPVPIIPPVPWPPTRLWLTLRWLHHEFPYENLLYGYWLDYAYPPNYWIGNQTLEGYFANTAVQVTAIGTRLTVNLNLTLWPNTVGAAIFLTDPIPNTLLWVIGGDLTNLIATWTAFNPQLSRTLI